MTSQLTITGEEEYVGNLKKDVEYLIEKYPASIDNVHLFAHVAAKNRIPWFSQLGEKRQKELVDFVFNFPTLDRRRREIKESVQK
jgi:hypothetical protein